MNNSSRTNWINWLERMVRPPLTAATNGQLKASIPGPTPPERSPSQPLETMGRILAGIAPWLQLSTPDHPEEQALRDELSTLFLKGLEMGCQRGHPDFWGFADNHQSLVDAAFLAQALLRAPRLIEGMSGERKQSLLHAFTSTQSIRPGFNNWLLFSACVEAGRHALGADGDVMRVDYALRQHEQWYKGDGVYGDGPEFHQDYYNSFVIQPMMLDILDGFPHACPEWTDQQSRHIRRAIRYAEQQERMIASDGSWPPTGRSLTYRCGAFHALSTMAWRDELPESLNPAGVRCALYAALQKSLGAPDTFDEKGWLQIGLCGYQPSLGEGYISVPSQYLACFVFPALGLPPEHAFWSDPDAPWTQVRIWENHEDLPADHALRDC